MKINKLVIGIAGTLLTALGVNMASAEETFFVPGSACLLKRDTYSVQRNLSELRVVSDWAEITCPLPRSTPITRIQVNTAGIVAGDQAIVGCVAGSGSYRRDYAAQNRFIYNGSSLGDVSCMLKRNDLIRSIVITVR